MHKFLIERTIPGAGQLSPEELIEVAKKSQAVINQLGPEVQWVESYVTADKITCVYLSSNAELVREHARRGKFPADRVEEITAIIDSGTASGMLWSTAPSVVA